MSGLFWGNRPHPACKGLLDGGCGLYMAQKPIPAVSPLKGSLPCVLDCNGVGNCLATEGFCQCGAGETGRCTAAGTRPGKRRPARPGPRSFRATRGGGRAVSPAATVPFPRLDRTGVHHPAQTALLQRHAQHDGL